MVERINDIVRAIVNICGDAESSGAELSPALFGNISNLTEYLLSPQRASVTDAPESPHLHQQVDMNMVQRITHHLEHEAQLNECNVALDHTMDVFTFQTDLETAAAIAKMKRSGTEKHEEFARTHSSHLEMLSLSPGASEKQPRPRISPSARSHCSLIAAYFGLEQQRGKVDKAVVQFLSAIRGQSVLVLDNFESPWEGQATRSLRATSLMSEGADKRPPFATPPWPILGEIARPGSKFLPRFENACEQLPAIPTDISPTEAAHLRADPPFPQLPVSPIHRPGPPAFQQSRQHFCCVRLTPMIPPLN
ncbi:hypothetical protein DFH09DRAFT_1094103 [Mycena vulgaris]|nr:hypothetical protein DFH09DRAFT_1094103 [Mycena vulgaris]